MNKFKKDTFARVIEEYQYAKKDLKRAIILEIIVTINQVKRLLRKLKS